MIDVLCLGEILVDWICSTKGLELDEAEHFTKAAGGAPANTAIGLARQNINVAFIGRVSDDGFGKWLLNILNSHHIDTTATISDASAKTRMAYVVTTLNGDRKLAEFSRIACADTKLSIEDLCIDHFYQASILHFGSISLIASPASETTKKAVELAKENNMLISYDPNIRLPLWESPEKCKQTILNTLHWGDIVKINEDELLFLTGSKDLINADRLRQEYNICLLIITLDARGAYITTIMGSKVIEGFDIKLVEATGAGDGFNSGVLSGILEHVKNSADRRKKLEQLDLSELTRIITRANAIGAITCTRAGAMTALPQINEIEEFIKNQTCLDL